MGGRLQALTAPPQRPPLRVYVRDDEPGHRVDRPSWPEPRLFRTAGAERLGRCRRTLSRGAAADPLRADTVHIRTLYLKYFTAWATAHGLTKPEEVTRADLERYQRWLYHYRKRTGGPLSVWSQHGRLVAVKGLFRWLTKQRALSANPAAELELPRVTAQR